MKERLEELEELLSKECGKYDTDCSKCPYKSECEEYERLYSEL